MSVRYSFHDNCGTAKEIAKLVLECKNKTQPIGYISNVESDMPTWRGENAINLLYRNPIGPSNIEMVTCLTWQPSWHVAANVGTNRGTNTGTACAFTVPPPITLVHPHWCTLTEPSLHPWWTRVPPGCRHTITRTCIHMHE